jgi:O-antigen/teichoic acid export membrane protein
MTTDSSTRTDESGAQTGTTAPGGRRSLLTALRRLKSNAFRRLGWGIADQVVSSLTNFAVSIYVVRVLGAVQFGAFSLVYVTYAFALNASRGLATDPLIVRFSGTDHATWRRAVARCTGTATIVGLVLGACMIAAGPVIGGKTGSGFVALGLTLPGLMLQDSWRYTFFALGRGGRAFVNDVVWGLTLIPALVLLRLTGHSNVFWFILAWGLTANIAAAIGPLQARVLPRLPRIWEWLAQHRDLGWRYLAEGTSNSLAGQLRTYGIGLLLGLAALGYVQAVSTLSGPITILWLGMSLTAIPEGARALRRSSRHLLLFCVATSVGMAIAGLAWGLALLIALPRGLGSAVLGSVWRPTYPLVLPQTIYLVGLGASFGAGVGQHVLGAAKRSLRAMVLQSIVFLICGLLGAATAGARGAVTGAAVAAWIGAVITWWQLRAAWRESGHTSADGSVLPGRFRRSSG